MRKREKARKNNEQLQKQLDDQIKEKAVLQEKAKEIKVLEEERNKIQKMLKKK